MDRTEFDHFADEYEALHERSIGFSGEAPEYFARYKVEDVANVCSVVTPKRVLDFGAGVGNSVGHFRAVFPSAEITCLDVSPQSLAVARSRHGDAARFVLFDGRTLPFSNASFDVVFVACVLHHIDGNEHVALLREMARVLVKGGHLVAFEHNPFNPLTRHAVKTCEFDANAVLLRAGQLRRRFAAAGLGSVEVAYRLFFPHALRGLRGLEKHLEWLPFGAQYRVVGRR
jgi:ubiquinone/menaquinone biosynthesis C-methylase UbiE